MKKTILFAIILFLIVPATISEGIQYSEPQILQGMLEEFKGELLETEISMGGIISEYFFTMEKLEELANGLKPIFNIQEIKINKDFVNSNQKNYYTLEKTDEETFKQILISGYNKKGNPVTISISTYLNTDTNKGETYLFTNLIKSEKNFNNNDIIEELKNVFAYYNKPLEITTCVVGRKNGQMNTKDFNKYIADFLRTYNIKIAEEYKDEYTISYTGYTNLFEQTIFSGEKKVNLNLAMRYNEFEDMTYIWIGTPIITTGY